MCICLQIIENLDLALRLVKLMTLKEHMSGEAPNFTNNAGHETQMMRRETVPKIYEHHHQHQVSRTDVAKPHKFCAQVQRFAMQES